MIPAERKQPNAGMTARDRADASVGRAVVDDRDDDVLFPEIAKLGFDRSETRKRVGTAVPVDDDYVGDGNGQDEPPRRRMMRSRMDGGRSGRHNAAAKISFVGSM